MKKAAWWGGFWNGSGWRAAMRAMLRKAGQAIRVRRRRGQPEPGDWPTPAEVPQEVIPAVEAERIRSRRSQQRLMIWLAVCLLVIFVTVYTGRSIWLPRMPVDYPAPAVHYPAAPPAYQNSSASGFVQPPAAGHSEYHPTGDSVHVKGYYRSNGTYVAPHERSAPHRRH